MLKKRLVPKLLIRHRQIGRLTRPVLVTTRQYREIIEVGDPVSQAKIYEAQMADELIVLNINGTTIQEDDALLELIERLASETFMPLAIGGGVRTVDDFALLLERGADKVTINTAALESPELIEAAASRFGAQCVVVSIDYRHLQGLGPMVLKNRAEETTGRHAVEWALEAVSRGAGELVVVDADRDGTGQGLDIETIGEISSRVSVPVVASGGCGLSSHFADGFLKGGAEAVSAGTFFAFRDQNPLQTRSQVRNAGVHIRTVT